MDRRLGIVRPASGHAQEIAVRATGARLANQPAWREFARLGRTVGGGAVRCQRVERVERCARTNVAPLGVQRDLNIPRTLRRTFGHVDCGVLQRVTRGGTLTLGETIDVV